MRRLTLDRLTLIITFALLFTIATRIPVDTDTWWHIRSGEYTLTHGMIYTDPFSHTKLGAEWINHSWGAQIILYGAYQGFGNIGLSLYTALLAVGGMAFLYPVCKGNVYLRGFLMVLGATTAAVFWSARPQMVSFFLSCVTIYLLYHYKTTPSRRVWWLVPMMWLWGNLHAGYSIGFIFLGAFIIGEIANNVFNTGEMRLSWVNIRTLLVVTVLCGAVLIITPYGIKTWLVPFQTVGIGALRDYIQEWNSPNFQGRETWTFIAMLIVSFAGAWLSRLKWDWTGFMLFSGTLFMALLYGRNVSVFAVAVLPQVSFLLDNVLTEHSWILRPRATTARTARLNAVLLGVVLLGVAIYLLGVVWSPQTIETAQNQFLPVKAVEYLNTHQPPKQMFNSYNWGGYMMLFAPDYPVFIDGRTDLYGEFLRVYLETTQALGDWRGVLNQYGVNVVVIENGVGLDNALRNDPNWSLDYEDEMAVIYTRKGVRS